jgi:hypothetical protein
MAILLNTAMDPSSEGLDHMLPSARGENSLSPSAFRYLLFRSDALATGRMAELPYVARDRGPHTP